MSIPVSPAWMVTVMAVAIGLVLILVAFNRKLPDGARRVLEAIVSIGYPAIIGAFFCVMAWNHYQGAEINSAIGFAVGAALMLALTVRAWLRGRKHT